MRKAGIHLLIGLFCIVISAGIVQATTLEWWKQAAAPYKGVTIRGISESTPASMAIFNHAAPEFEELTGIKIEFEPTSWDDMYSKSIDDMAAGAGIYDFVYVEQDIIYTYTAKKWLTDLTEFMDKYPQLTEPDLDLDDFTSFIDYFKDEREHVFGLPFEAYLKTYVYRKDLFGDPEVRAAFKSEYGWDLRPPKDWKEYEQIAKFFTGWGKEKGLRLYGHTAQATTHPCLAYEMIETIWPAWGIYNWGINLETWRSSVANGGTLNSRLAKETLRWYIDMLKYAPPGVRTYTWTEAAESVAAGIVAQGIIYGEMTSWVALDPEKSTVVDQIGVAVVPTRPEAMSDAVRGLGYIGYYDGGALGIPHSSKKKEAAWLFIQWVVRKEWGPKMAELAAGVVRTSTLVSPKIKELDKRITRYFTVLKDSGFLYWGAPPFPMHATIHEIYLTWISKAVAGEVTPEDALDSLAKEVDEKLAELGY